MFRRVFDVSPVGVKNVFEAVVEGNGVVLPPPGLLWTTGHSRRMRSHAAGVYIAMLAVSAEPRRWWRWWSLGHGAVKWDVSCEL